MDLRDALGRVTSGGTLTVDESREVFGGALEGAADPALLGGLLAALATRRVTLDELEGAARALRARMRPFVHDHPDAVDTCGTGGSGLGTILVIAGPGSDGGRFDFHDCTVGAQATTATAGVVVFNGGGATRQSLLARASNFAITGAQSAVVMFATRDVDWSRGSDTS